MKYLYLNRTLALSVISLAVSLTSFIYVLNRQQTANSKVRYLNEVRQQAATPVHVPEAVIEAAIQYQVRLFITNLRSVSTDAQVRRTVEIESLLRITTNSYQVDWIESTVDNAAARTSRRMRALVTTTLLPTTDDTIKRNPLGIYIDNCEMTEL